MAITREEKREILKKLEEKISKAISLIFVGYTGLKVKEQETLRKLLKNENNELFITKKRLLNLVLAKFKFEKIKELKLEKEIGLVLGYKDEISPLKIVFNFSKEHENLKIKGGIFEKKVISLEEIRFLTLLPSKEILYSQLVYLIKNPLNRLVNILKGNLRNLVYILNIITNQSSYKNSSKIIY